MSKGPEREALEQMNERGGTWAAYENMDMSSRHVGHLQFLKVGCGCTFDTPPSQMPDNTYGVGWRYRYIGYVNLNTGEITLRPVANENEVVCDKVEEKA